VAEEPIPPHTLNSTLAGPIEDTLYKGLAKKPGDRYATCKEFVRNLEKACSASRTWKPLARGATLNEPTMADAPRGGVTLPPARNPRRSEATGANPAGERSRLGFLPFLAAVLMAAGVIALVSWQAAPSWLLPGGRGGATAGRTTEPEKSRATTAAVSKPAAPRQPAPSATAESKPSPMPRAPEQALSEETKPAEQPAKPLNAAADVPGKAAAQPPAEGPPRRSAPAAVPEPAEVTVITSPAGATAMLDGRHETACSTPCSVDAAPGRHTVSIVKPGYQAEHRDVAVGSGPLELPIVILRATQGTLWITSSPAGAAITINGKRFPQNTPAQIPLPPGSYRVVVEKNGEQNTSALEIRNGETKVLKVSLGQ